MAYKRGWIKRNVVVMSFWAQFFPFCIFGIELLVSNVHFKTTLCLFFYDVHYMYLLIIYNHYCITIVLCSKIYMHAELYLH